MQPNNYPKHGFTGKRYQQTYEAMLTQQNGFCLICARHHTEVKKKRTDGRRKFCIDHCHVTGRIRGLLCESCNLMLGKVENYGCDALNTKIPMDELIRTSQERFNLRLETDTRFSNLVERDKIRRMTYTEETYKEMHEWIDQWMGKYKQAVVTYLSHT